MADYSISAEMTLDTKKFNNGINKADKSLKSFSKQLSESINKLGQKGMLGTMANLSLAMGGLVGSFKLVTNTVKKVSKSINEVTEAYKTQLMAERALDTAIMNNPYMDGTSSRALKEFASDIQSVTNYGDEQLLPLIANLTSLGRTQEEIMQIVRVATDMASTGTMSLDTAITQLNATLNGNIGRLGQQNAELKDLTEEELRSGRAVEILGEKFKGLSKATIDTSRQLQNIKGDFKEALGEFTLPSSDVWNKFWAGFYEKGTIYVKRLNDALQIKADYKATKKYVEETAKWIVHLKPAEQAEAWAKIATGLDETNLRAMSEALQIQLEKGGGLKTLENDFLEALEHEILLRREAEKIQERINSTSTEDIEDEDEIVKLKEKYIALISEQEAKWANIKLVTGEAVSDEEKLKFYQEQLVAIMTEAKGQISESNSYYVQQKAIIDSLTSSIESQKQTTEEIAEITSSIWGVKLLEQKIEMLETERNIAIQNAEETGEETYAIYRHYNERLLELKLERLRNEKEKALKEEGLSEEDKLAINEYYANEEKKIIDELGDYKSDERDDEEEDEESMLARMLQAWKNFASNVVKVVKKVFSTISKVVKAGFDFFKEIASFSISDTLDAILKFEDGVLTFFVLTLPQLPQFVASVFQSIRVLLDNLVNCIKAESISDIVFQMLKTIGDNLPDMVSDLLTILTEMVNGAIDGLIKWLGEGDGLNTILNCVLEIQKTFETLFTDNISKIVDFLAEHVEDIADFLAESMASANRTLPKIISAILKLITTIIDVVAKAFENQDFIDSIVESIEGVIDAIIEIVPKFITSIIKLIFAILKAIVPKLPEIILYIIRAIVDALPDLVSDIASALGEGISAIFKEIFTVDFWSDILTGLGEAISGMLSNIGEIAFSDSSGNVSGGKIALGVLTGGVSTAIDGIGKMFNWWATGTNNAPAGLSIVGEAGPELVKFRGGEQVINNRNTQKLLRETGGTSNNFSVVFNNTQDTTAYAMLQQLKQYNRQLSINGVL